MFSKRLPVDLPTTALAIGVLLLAWLATDTGSGPAWALLGANCTLLTYRAMRRIGVIREQTVALSGEADAARLAMQTSWSQFSHRWRTPLNSIMGYTELLLDEPVIRQHKVLRTDLVRIRDASQEMLAMVDDVLGIEDPDSLGRSTSIQAGQVNHDPASAPPGVLVVDEHRDPIDQLCSQLIRCGFSVTLVGEGEHAALLAAQLKPALIILDPDMRSVDGWRVLREIKSGDQTRDIPILLYNADIDPEHARRLGAVDCLAPTDSVDRLLGQLLRFDAFSAHITGRRAPHT